MNPLTTLLLASPFLMTAGAIPVASLPPSEPPTGVAVPTHRRHRSPEESTRRQLAAFDKRIRRMHRRRELAANAREVAIAAVALSPVLRPLRDERYPEELLYDLAARVVADLLTDLRWTSDRIRHDPAAAAAACAWGTR